MSRTKVAIIGSGNIGTDLMMKIRKQSDHLDLVAMAGVDPESDGLRRAAAEGLAVASEGLEGLRRLKAKHEDSRVIFLTMHANAKLAAEAFRLGARGFVLKHASGEELVKAIEAVLEGHKYMSAALTDEVLDLMSAPSSAPGPALTSRQTEVLRLIVNGQRMKEIASSLNLSPRTVETIKYEIMRELEEILGQKLPETDPERPQEPSS